MHATDREREALIELDSEVAGSRRLQVPRDPLRGRSPRPGVTNARAALIPAAGLSQHTAPCSAGAGSITTFQAALAGIQK